LNDNVDVEKRNIGTWKSWDKQRLIPDIIITKNDEVLLLADAKYKLKYTIEDRRQGREYLHEYLKKVDKGHIKFEKKYMIRKCLILLT